MVLVTVVRTTSRRTRGRPPKVLVTADVRDDSGTLRVTFFNQAWRERQLAEGLTVALFGKVDLFNGRKQMTNPVVDLIGNRTGPHRAHLPAVREGPPVDVGDRRLGGRGPAAVGHPRPGRPGARVGARPLRPRHPARGVRRHPRPRVDGAQGGGPPPARARRAAARPARPGPAQAAHRAHDPRHRPGHRGPAAGRVRRPLPFDLTADQRAAIAEIGGDLAAPHPMHRLLQGDVGAGKTVVAVWTLLAAVQGGHQGAFMAPTEVLAEQHALGIRALLADVEVPDAGTSLFGARPRPGRAADQQGRGGRPAAHPRRPGRG